MTNNLIDYEMIFTDLTIIEGEGEFVAISDIMKNDGAAKGWMIETALQMIIKMPGKILEAVFTLHFYDTGVIYVTNYMPSGGEMNFYSPDIRGLFSWALNNGWKTVTPSNDLVRDNMVFWKNCWETNLVESKYIEEQCG